MPLQDLFKSINFLLIENWHILKIDILYNIYIDFS